jgi:hypothetical protein
MRPSSENPAPRWSDERMNLPSERLHADSVGLSLAPLSWTATLAGLAAPGLERQPARASCGGSDPRKLILPHKRGGDQAWKRQPRYLFPCAATTWSKPPARNKAVAIGSDSAGYSAQVGSALASLSGDLALLILDRSFFLRPRPLVPQARGAPEQLTPNDEPLSTSRRPLVACQP